jgi:hypothetical protein
VVEARISVLVDKENTRICDNTLVEFLIGASTDASASCGSNSA